jgi:hypothetical protein
MSNREEDLRGLKGRLKAGTLTQEDVARLVDLVSKAEEAAALEATSTKTIEGRKVIARLPYGIDVVK